ncbi:hypothetical protein PVAP13_2KG497105 [Panicum virgatum]|uniref:Uncharacterized protein n=1 Tax=Panicum virgatum TaxID=38727 RepID=A0A8T0WM62_PANVG|nr:hypothetical protein PVAP13_2KG497105 [Panicum virgatum]
MAGGCLLPRPLPVGCGGGIRAAPPRLIILRVPPGRHGREPPRATRTTRTGGAGARRTTRTGGAGRDRHRGREEEDEDGRRGREEDDEDGRRGSGQAPRARGGRRGRAAR